MVFDDVFVPWERVFLCGEWEFAGEIVDKFVRIHRTIGSGCKAGFLDIMIGAAATIAEYNGVPRAGHIINKIGEMVLAQEGAYGTGLAAAHMGETLPTGIFVPHPLMCNVTKIQGFNAVLKVAGLLADIAGGLCVNAPMEADFRSPEIGPLVEKYLKGVDSVCTEDRLRMMKLIEYWVSGPHLAGAIQGGGPPEAQRLMLLKSADVRKMQTIAKELAGIKV
jgi:aromatic ring hydroxylase